MLRHLLQVLAVCLALSACSGGGSSSSALPVGSGGAGSGLQSVTIAIRIPAATSAAGVARRHALYISSGTQSISIGVNALPRVIVGLASGSPNCTQVGGGPRTCSVVVSAPVGNDTFSETMYASTDGTGAPLSQNTISAPIASGQANVVNLVLDGVIAAMSLALSDATPPQGIAAKIGLSVTFKDASGAIIIGSDLFANPVALTDSDSSGITTLSKLALNTPADAAGLTVTYTGSPLSSAVFAATAVGGVSASATLKPTPVTFNDYTTFGYDNQRDIYNPNSATITPSSVTKLHVVWQQKLGGGDYSVQAQPILATRIGSHAGILIAGGGSGNIAAHDALTGAQLWRTYTGQLVYTCSPGQPKNYYGVGGTAAYDPNTGRVYVATNSNSTTNGPSQSNLVELDAGSGSIRRQVNYAPSQVNSNELNFVHTSVTLGGNGVAYAGTGASCDISSWRGRVAAVNVASMSLASTFFPVWNPQLGQPYGGGGIWGWGGVSLDFNGNVFTGVGNADHYSPNGTIAPPFVPAPQEYSSNGEAFVALSADLQTVMASDHPIPRGIYNQQVNDLDLNGTPAIFKPFGTGCDTMAALQAKSGALILYDTTRISSGPSAQFQLAPSTYADGFLGDPAFSQATGLLYAAVASSQSPDLFSPGMIAINPGCGSPAVTWHAAFGPDSTSTGVPRSVPAVSAGGVVFIATACDAPSGSCGGNGPYGALWELDASNGAVLNSGKPLLYTNAVIRAPVTIDGNWIYVVDTVGDLYGLTIDSSYPAVSAINRFAGNRAALPPAPTYSRKM